MKKFTCTLKSITYGKQYEAMLIKSPVLGTYLTYKYVLDGKTCSRAYNESDMLDFTAFADKTAMFATERMHKENDSTVRELWQIEDIKEIAKAK
jgi:hypothetical protein